MGVIIVVLVAAGSLLALFHSIVWAALFSCIRADPNMALLSPALDLGVTLACLLLAWIMGFSQEGTFTFQYVGTRFYGRAQTERGYITTKWLVAGFPLLPIRSYRVLYRLKEVSGYEFEYEKDLMEPVEGYFHWKQMLRTAAISYLTLLWSWGCLWLMFTGACA